MARLTIHTQPVALSAADMVACATCGSLACQLDSRTWRDGVHYCRHVRTVGAEVTGRPVTTKITTRPRAGGRAS